MTLPSHPVLLFDGVCTLCDGAVQWVIDHDPDRVFRFASLQSEIGKTLARRAHIDASLLDTVVLIQDGRAWTESDAVLRAVRLLPRPWSLLAAASIVPTSLRNSVYRFIARHRLRWFGQRAECRIPTPALRSLFLDTPS